MAVELKQEVWQWLLRSGAVNEAHIAEDDHASVRLSNNGRRILENGVMMLNVLRAIDPNLDLKGRDESTPLARTFNWNNIAKVLPKHGVPLDPDMKMLIVAGDTDIIVSTLEELFNKIEGEHDPEQQLHEGKHEEKHQNGHGRGKKRGAKGAKYGRTGNADGSTGTIDGSRSRHDGTTVPTQNLSETEAFFSSTLGAALGLDQPTASSWISSATRGDARAVSAILRQGHHGDHLPVVNWLSDVLSNVLRLNDMIGGDYRSLQCVQQVLEGGLLSPSADVAAMTCRILAALDCDTSPSVVEHSWLWLSSTGMKSIITCWQTHVDARFAVVAVILRYAAGRWYPVLYHALRTAAGSNGAYMAVVTDLIQPLAEGQGYDALARDGVVDALLSFAVENSGPASAIGDRIHAVGLLVAIWRVFPDLLAARVEAPKNVLELLRAASRDTDRSLQAAAITSLFQLLDTFTATQNPFAPVCYKTLIFSMIENHGDELAREHIIAHMANVLQRNPDIPVQVMVEPLVKQHTLHGFTDKDFDFFLVIAKHPRLPLRHGMLLMHLLGKVSINDSQFGRLAAVPFLALVTRFHTEETLVDYVEKYTRVALSVFMKADQLSRDPKASGTERDASVMKASLCLEMIAKICHLRHKVLCDRVEPVVLSAMSEYERERGRAHSGLESLARYLSSEPMVEDATAVQRALPGQNNYLSPRSRAKAQLAQGKTPGDINLGRSTPPSGDAAGVRSGKKQPGVAEVLAAQQTVAVADVTAASMPKHDLAAAPEPGAHSRTPKRPALAKQQSEHRSPAAKQRTPSRVRVEATPKPEQPKGAAPGVLATEANPQGPTALQGSASAAETRPAPVKRKQTVAPAAEAEIVRDVAQPIEAAALLKQQRRPLKILFKHFAGKAPAVHKPRSFDDLERTSESWSVSDFTRFWLAVDVCPRLISKGPLLTVFHILETEHELSFEAFLSSVWLVAQNVNNPASTAQAGSGAESGTAGEPPQPANSGPTTLGTPTERLETVLKLIRQQTEQNKVGPQGLWEKPAKAPEPAAAPAVELLPNQKKHLEQIHNPTKPLTKAEKIERQATIRKQAQPSLAKPNSVDSDSKAPVASPSTIARLNALLVQDPNASLPEGFERVAVETQEVVSYEAPKDRPESERVALEVLDRVLVNAAEVHAVPPTSVKRIRYEARPTANSGAGRALQRQPSDASKHGQRDASPAAAERAAALQAAEQRRVAYLKKKKEEELKKEKEEKEQAAAAQRAEADERKRKAEELRQRLEQLRQEKAKAKADEEAKLKGKKEQEEKVRREQTKLDMEKRSEERKRLEEFRKKKEEEEAQRQKEELAKKRAEALERKKLTDEYLKQKREKEERQKQQQAEKEKQRQEQEQAAQLPNADNAAPNSPTSPLASPAATTNRSQPTKKAAVPASPKAAAASPKAAVAKSNGTAAQSTVKPSAPSTKKPSSTKNKTKQDTTVDAESSAKVQSPRGAGKETVTSAPQEAQAPASETLVPPTTPAEPASSVITSDPVLSPSDQSAEPQLLSEQPQQSPDNSQQPVSEAATAAA